MYYANFNSPFSLDFGAFGHIVWPRFGANQAATSDVAAPAPAFIAAAILITPKTRNGEGLVFNRDLRLNPGVYRQLKIQIIGEQTTPEMPIKLELLPHPSTPVVNRTLIVAAKAAR